MNLIDKTQILPAGLTNKGVEFFIDEHEVKCLHAGCTFSFDEFPPHVVQLIDEDMASNPRAIKALLDWDITDSKEQMRQYIACRFGGFDCKPDINDDGILQAAEYVDCGRRGKCAYEGKLCSSIVVSNGILTKKEIEVLRLIAIGLLDKEICEKMNPPISNDTLRSHKDNIAEKAGIRYKAEMVALAYIHGLLKE